MAKSVDEYSMITLAQFNALPDEEPETNEVQYLFAFEAGGEQDRLPDYAMFVKLLNNSKTFVKPCLIISVFIAIFGCTCDFLRGK